MGEDCCFLKPAKPKENETEPKVQYRVNLKCRFANIAIIYGSATDSMSHDFSHMILFKVNSINHAYLSYSH